jgi:hypothetical protein
MQVKGLTSANVVTLGTSEYLRVPVSRGAGCGGVGSRIDDGPLGSSLLDRGLDGDLFRGKEGPRNPLTRAFACQSIRDVSQEYRRLPSVSVGSLTRC